MLFCSGEVLCEIFESVVIVLKLELIVVILVMKVNKVIMRELEGRLKINSVIYWIDFMIVFKYIVNEV